MRIRQKSSEWVLKQYRHLAHLDLWMRYQPELCACIPGEALFLPEQSSQFLFFVLSGRLSAAVSNAGGDEIIHIFCGPGEVLGEVEFFLHRPSFSTVTALSSCAVLRISVSRCRDAISGDPEMLGFLGENLAKKLVSTAQNSARNILAPLKARLAARILAVAQGGVYRESLVLLADYFGVSYRHLQRLLHGFVQQGVLERQTKGVYRVKDPEALHRCAEAAEKTDYE